MKYFSGFPFIFGLFMLFSFSASAQCDIRVDAIPGNTEIRFSPVLTAAQLSAVQAFFGDNFLSSDEISSNTRVFLSSGISEDELFSLPSLLCPDVQCVHTVERGSGDDDLLISPVISAAQYAAILEIKSDIDDFEQFSSGESYIEFDSPISDAELAAIINAICPELVPTMGEWGIMSLGLLLLIFGVVTYKEQIRKMAVAFFL